MQAEYKVNLVKELPHQQKPVNRSPRLGGFGLPEDDLIYQMVRDQLADEDRSHHRRRSSRYDRDE